MMIVACSDVRHEKMNTADKKKEKEQDGKTKKKKLDIRTQEV